jgi:hypothetical protein
MEASVSCRGQDTPASDDTRSSAPAPCSRLLSAGEQACLHSAYVREHASQTLSRCGPLQRVRRETSSGQSLPEGPTETGGAASAAPESEPHGVAFEQQART